MTPIKQPRRETLPRKPSASLDSTPAPSISADYPDATPGAVAMGRHFIVWVRPSRSIMPWHPLADRRGQVVVSRSREDADACALRAMEGGSVCAWVGETLLPLEPSPTLCAVLSDGTSTCLRELADD